MKNRSVGELLALLCVVVWLAAGAGTGRAETGTPGEDLPVSAESRGSPAALFAETAFDFGKILPDRQYEHTFTVVNVGDGDLVIRKVVVG